MKTVIQSQIKTSVCRDKNRLFDVAKNRDNSVSTIDFKFYQKLVILLISVSVILIFPESPNEMEIVCKSYYPQRVCNVW